MSPLFKIGDMLQEVGRPGTLVCVTTCGITKADGSLVMGAGAAKQLAALAPTAPFDFGHTYTIRRHPSPYLLVIVPCSASWHLRSYLGAFQVKRHWREPASVQLIRDAALILGWVARREPDLKIHLNYPGIGCGHLDPATVAPLLEALPLNVTVWRLPE